MVDFPIKNDGFPSKPIADVSDVSIPSHGATSAWGENGSSHQARVHGTSWDDPLAAQLRCCDEWIEKKIMKKWIETVNHMIIFGLIVFLIESNDHLIDLWIESIF